MTIPPGCCEMWRGKPAISAHSSPNARQRGDASFASASGSAASSSWTRSGFAVGEAGEPLQLGERQAERLPQVADRAARAVGGEARDERGVLAAVLLGHGDDQLLADVAREVEVDVGDGLELTVEEPSERELRLDRVDVRETGQVADDRAHRAAAAAAGWEDVARDGSARAPRARPPAPARAPPSGGGRSRRGRARRSGRAPRRVALVLASCGRSRRVALFECAVATRGS